MKTEAVSTDLKMQPAVLAQALRDAAKGIEQLQGFSYWDAWRAVVKELSDGNRSWCDKQGVSGIQCAVDEIRRLYEADRTLKNALAKDAT